jgi:hypothetical protein
MRESGWLIESHFTSGTNKPMWLRLFAYKMTDIPKPEWTENSEVALRFANKDSALQPVLVCLVGPWSHLSLYSIFQPQRKETYVWIELCYKEKRK